MAQHLKLAGSDAGWRFEFDNAAMRAGLCSFSRKVISLSADYVQRNDESFVRDTILHEIAHVMAGPSAGHGNVWKLFARSIGARPERCASDETNTRTGRYVTTCPDCQGTLSMHRLGKIIKQGGQHTECRYKPNRGRLSIWTDTKTGVKIQSVRPFHQILDLSQKVA
jgi:predicted SprT family Zn-dependent metalloprotease